MGRRKKCSFSCSSDFSCSPCSSSSSSCSTAYLVPCNNNPCGTDNSCNPCGPCDPCKPPNPYITSSLPSCAIPVGACDEYNSGSDKCCPSRCAPRCAPRCSPCDLSCSFYALITPMTNVKPVYGTGHDGTVQFMLRRKNKVVSLQWEPFTGNVGNNGAAYMAVNQSISGLPNYPVDVPVSITYNGIASITLAEIDPLTSDQIKIYFNVGKTGSGVVLGDTVVVQGSCINWISDC